MEAAWLFFALAAPLLFSTAQVFDKFLREKHLGTVALTILMGTASFWALAILPFVNLTELFSSPIVVIVGLATGMLFILNSFPYFEAMSLEEASRIIPLWAFEAIFVLALAFTFLKERLVVVDYIGFFLVVSGAFLISARKVKDIFKPSKALLLMLLATFLTAAAVIISKWLYARLTFWQVQVLIGIGGGITGLLLLAVKPKSWKEISSLKRKTFGLMGLREIAVTGGFLLYSLAIKIGSPSLTVALSNLNALYMLVMATFISIFHPKILLEAIDRKTLLTKAIAISMIIAGVFAISM